MPWYENISFFSPQHQEIASFKKKPSHAIMQPIRRKLENNDISNWWNRVYWQRFNTPSCGRRQKSAGFIAPLF
jgi:hypothetical protein